MIVTNPSRVFEQHSNRLRNTVVVAWLSITMLSLGGCSYFETQLARTAAPDPRIQLGWQDRVFLRGEEIEKYTCRANYLLACERSGSITYSCTCQLR